MFRIETYKQACQILGEEQAKTLFGEQEEKEKEEKAPKSWSKYYIISAIIYILALGQFYNYLMSL